VAAEAVRPGGAGRVRRAASFDTLRNTYRFFALYANLEKWSPSDGDPPVASAASWIAGSCRAWRLVAATVTEHLDGYELTHAGAAIGDFVVDDLSNWYVRRSRDRFWGSADDCGRTRGAFRTLHEVLEVLSRLLAPFTPFHADWLHRALTGGPSVHLAPFPDGRGLKRDEALEEGMRGARAGAAGTRRPGAVKIRVRQPLGTAAGRGPGPR
jgi:isoleucyl-tRNA synthetase